MHTFIDKIKLPLYLSWDDDVFPLFKGFPSQSGAQQFIIPGRKIMEKPEVIESVQFFLGLGVTMNWIFEFEGVLRKVYNGSTSTKSQTFDLITLLWILMVVTQDLAQFPCFPN